jgi:hypothetical protein
VCLFRRKNGRKKPKKLVSSRDATKGRMKPKKYRFMFLLAQYATLFWAEVLESETCNKNLNGLKFPQFLVLNVNS